MKFLIIICLLLVSAFLTAGAQQSQTQKAFLARAETSEAERRLSDMGYWTGPVDGVFDTASRSALIAFQKWEGRPVTGKLTIDELEAIRASASSHTGSELAAPAGDVSRDKTTHNGSGATKATRGAPKARETGYAHVEVDLDRQVMLIVSDDGSVRVLPVSTGSGKPFMEDGQQSVAYTPRGRFVLYEKEVGWGHGPLGSVYYANYISGGVAIHGHKSVPNEPASHGCIRIPMFAAREVSKLLELGTIVLVYDKVSFVSAKEWVENPELKEAAMAESKKPDYTYHTEGTKTGARALVIRKVRQKIIRT